MIQTQKPAVTAENITEVKQAFAAIVRYTVEAKRIEAIIEPSQKDDDSKVYIKFYNKYAQNLANSKSLASEWIDILYMDVYRAIKTEILDATNTALHFAKLNEAILKPFKNDLEKGTLKDVALSKSDRLIFSQTLTALQKLLNKKRDIFSELINSQQTGKLTKYYKRLRDVRTEVNTHYQEMISDESGYNAQIVRIKKTIDDLHDSEDKYTDQLIGTGVGTGLGAFLTATVVFSWVGVPLLGGSAYGLSEAEDKLEKIKTALTTQSQELTRLNEFKAASASFQSVTNTLHNKLQNLVNEFQGVNDIIIDISGKLDNVISNVEIANDFDAIVEYYNIMMADLAKSNWEELQKYCNDIQFIDVVLIPETKKSQVKVD